MDGGACWATVHGAAKSQTGLSDFTFTLDPHASWKNEHHLWKALSVCFCLHWVFVAAPGLSPVVVGGPDTARLKSPGERALGVLVRKQRGQGVRARRPGCQPGRRAARRQWTAGSCSDSNRAEHPEARQPQTAPCVCVKSLQSCPTQRPRGL